MSAFAHTPGADWVHLRMLDDARPHPYSSSIEQIDQLKTPADEPLIADAVDREIGDAFAPWDNQNQPVTR